jgi:AAA domain
MTCGRPSENHLCGDCERSAITAAAAASPGVEPALDASPEALALDGGIYSPTLPLRGERRRRAVATRAADLRRERVEWLDPGRVPLGLVTVLAGVGGLGKSQWTCDLAGRVTRGVLGSAAAALMLTAEDSPTTTVVPRLEAVDADLERVRFVSIATEDGEDGLTIPDDLAELNRVVNETAARLVVIDPLVAHLPAGIDAHKDQSVRRALAPLHRLAQAHGCAVVALLHLNKAQGLAPLMRLAGTVAFGNAARSVLLLDRDPDDPEGDEGTQRVLAHIKCNVGPQMPSLLYRVTPVVLPATDEQPEVGTSRIELLGESAHNGRSLLEAANGTERSDVDDAVEFLLEELGDGARHPAEELFRAARRQGIRDHTLGRARKRIGAKTKKADFGRGWEWFLPTTTKMTTPAEADTPQGGCHLGAEPGIRAGSATSYANDGAEDDSTRTVSPSGGEPQVTLDDELAALPRDEQRFLDLLVAEFDGRWRDCEDEDEAA